MTWQIPMLFSPQPFLQEASEKYKIGEVLKGNSSVNDLANMMNVPVSKIIATCMSIGLVVAREDASLLTVTENGYGKRSEFSEYKRGGDA